MTATLSRNPLLASRLTDRGPSVSAVGDAAAFSAKGLSVKIGNNNIVDDVSLAGNFGELLGIIGPNGAGKTTLLKVLSGLLKPSLGGVEIVGVDLEKMPSSTRSRQIAYVPQITGAHPFTALELVLMGRYPHLRRFQIESEDDTEIAIEAMERMDVAQFKGRRVDTLSGGERQRVLLARALAQRGDVLFVDEPITSLDIKHQLLALQVLKDEARERSVAVCAVLHDLNMAARFCDRVVLLAEGRMIDEGEPDSVITERHVAEVFGVRARVARRARSNGVTVDLIEPSD